ncbi:DUF928 domain-containing protein [Moorena sp. SIO3A2]|uniref:DUF928 domain-containing protein n=1 Tax=Moorena sp. SIO3A2 TaxID=2607841 RepID=UPI0013BE35A7|nr:DUF928 domain-containing protein [Moorena sp. SIO3A2]NER88885.1 DUF928 domain-containing protein [Moorena sp. SIO3A2]
MMIQIFWFLNKCIKAKLVTSCILGLSLVITPAALAEYEFPSDQKPPSDYTGQAGSRDGCEGEGIPLTALVPLSHVGQTASTRPTFAWFVPDSTTKKMEFTLYEYDSNGKPKLMGEAIPLKSWPGVMTLTLPEDRPELRVGRTYLWQVTILCDPDNASSDLIARADIQVLEMPSTLESTFVDGSNKSDFYAKASLWYDALAEALKLANESRLGEVGSTLLENLAELEAAALTDEEYERIENLRQIASSLR